MNKLISGIVVSATLLLAACGTQVEVPPAHVGKLLTKNGYAPDTISPSKFRLDSCVSYCDRLVLLEASDSALKEELMVFMPEDKLNLSVEIRGTFTIPNDQKQVDTIYDRVVSEEMNNFESIIKASTVYSVYGQQAIRGVVRSELTKYTIGQILEQREAIGANIHAAIQKKLAETKTPISVSRFELANISPPKVIVESQEAAKTRELDIQKANANAQVALVEAEKDLEVAKKTRLVAREQAESIAEQNRIAANSVTPQLLEYRRLEVAERIYGELAKSNNVIVVPADSSGFQNFGQSAVFSKMLGKELGDNK